MEMRPRLGLSTNDQDTAVRGRRRATRPVLVAAALAGAAALAPEQASACGACYASNNESTVVNDHRMALSISKQRTILWDQIQYSGNPKEFAYVLPAKPGTKLEASTDAWFNALDVSTRPLIMPPPTPPYSGGGGGEGDDSCGGCSSMDEASAFSAGGGADAPAEKVEVIDQAAVGPYDTVTVRSTDPEALQKWLVDHGYAVPPISAPIIATYVQSGFDFIALRLHPGQNERQIEPIRIVSPGVDPNLPLRLMRIGAGPKVGITLYVLAEGRYRPANFPEGKIDFGKLIWDYAQSRSNYQELVLAAMATENGRAVVTEYAQQPSFSDTAATPIPGPGGNMTGNPPLRAAFTQACAASPPVPQAPLDDGTATDDDAGAAADAAAETGAADAGADADAGGSDGETAGDAGYAPEGGRPRVEAKCDDLDVAIEGLAIQDVWLARIRFNLPNAALDDELRLEPAPQERVENVHQTTAPGTITTASVAPHRARRRHGTYALVGLTAFVVSRLVRRRRS
jgi:hypothetical protein